MKKEIIQSDFENEGEKKPLRNTEKSRDPYDGIRFWSALTHGIGVLLSVAGTAWLIARAGIDGSDVWKIVSFAIYGASMICLYTASTLYHCLRTSVNGRIALKKYDHISIYLLIAGTYTPVCLVALRGTLGWWLFGIIWGLAVAGFILTLFWVSCPRWFSSVVYIAMGWIAIAAVYPLWKAIGWGGVSLLILGGVIYTVGGVFYAVKWPGRNNPRFGCHEIFHVFILLGSAAMFMMMRYTILPM